MFATKFTALLFALVSSVSASAIWDPTILTPNAQSVWVRGQTTEVTWDTSNPPANATQFIGQVRLAKGGIQGYGVLASGFHLADGSVEVTVPSGLDPGSDYQVVLFGDSGNVSPEFTIR
ncbi:hypothetical protein FOMPIDRAFT_1111829 [Fomitopsis schrenkii]|uniref:Yeast cell wall synthesis Kre9/Knh1-like N-terminal domain-containing protein n=1 Tax=Fomitopsis schrenkii TaxID=2126942 RepID=S8ELZ0_FOMSC|nr:hypothetical protein FOMPIDRAFT_1111829 [Fomitopsis schrenkii]